VNSLPLVIFHKQLGDLLLTEPALHKLASATGGRVRLSTRKGFLPMVSLMREVVGESSISLNAAPSVLSFSWNLHAGLKALATCSPNKRLVVSNSEYIRSWHRMVYGRRVEVWPIENAYQAKYYFDAVPCEKDVAFRPPELDQAPAGWRHPELPGDYILIHATSAWRSKSWPSQNWVEIIRSLHRKGVGPFVITGGSAEWERNYTREIASQAGVCVCNLGGRSNLEQYLHALAHARLVLCVDGSSSHLAAAFRRPCVTLFGSTPAERWHWKTDLSTALQPPAAKRALKGSVQFIAVEIVLEAALAALNAHQAGGIHAAPSVLT
jgi:ADP-heptose:LPS heptosyltransferase